MVIDNKESKRILSVDPGDSTGLALWNGLGELLWMKKMPLEDFIIWAGMSRLGERLKVIVCEDFTLRPRAGRNLNAKGNKLKAAQAIGVVKWLAYAHMSKLVMQQPNILGVAELHARVAHKSHQPDDVSAYLHGYYYFETIGVLRPKPLD